MGAMTNMGTVRPLTVLDEDESMLRGMVADFAKNEIGPNVRRMDNEGVFDKGLLKQMFELGLMGIEIPEEYGGQGGTFFQALIAIEELAAVDPSAGVIVDVQNTLVNNAEMGDHRSEAALAAATGEGHARGVCVVRGGRGLGCIRFADSRDR